MNFVMFDEHNKLIKSVLEKEVITMGGRGTDNSPNTRNPERPASKPSRLDQFADDLVEKDKGEKKGVTSRKEKRKWL